MGVVSQLGLGLAKTREGLLGSLRRLLPGGRKLTPELYEALEGALLAADVGVEAATALMDAGRGLVWQSGEADADSVRAVLKKVMIERLRTNGKVETVLNAPHVILLAGVNGVGKTTVAGKLAGLYGRQGKRVVLVAADTFRAAAGEQLELWGRRVGAEVVRHQAGGDPAAVAYDGVAAAQARKADVALVDTAGRLHTKSNLMDELRKVKRTLGKAVAGAPHDVWPILGATGGPTGGGQGARLRQG